MSPIVQFPHPVLTTPCVAVAEVNANVRDVVLQMFKIVRAVKGAGLAAPQIGLPLRIAVVEAEGTALALVNPEVIELGPECAVREGCLSLSSVADFVKRAEWVRVKCLDEGGHPVEFTANGLLGQAVQHEIDHLNGRLFVDLLDRFSRKRVIEKHRKIVSARREAAQRGTGRR